MRFTLLHPREQLVNTLTEAQLLPFDSRHNEWPEFVPNFHSSRERAQCRQLTEFDTKTIPESYILLRDVPRIPYGTQYHAPRQIATAVSLQTPVLLIQNDSVLTVGGDILQAFDRLEVAEYSARALIDTATIGPLVPIAGQDIRDLEDTFFPQVPAK